MKKFSLIFCALFAVKAQAAVVGTLNLTFDSGAHFSGQVSFSDDYSAVTGVNGVLRGYVPTEVGFVGWGETWFQNLYGDGYNFSSDAFNTNVFFIDNGDIFAGVDGGPGYSNWISFSYDYSSPAAISFSASGYGNSVDYDDKLVSGALALPESSSLALMALGLAGLLGYRRFTQG